jgi:hypothetical protein
MPWAPNCEIKTSWLATARLRFGYAFDSIMAYVTAGAAISRLVASTAGAPFGTDRKNNLGWTLGLGVEFVIWGPWMVKAEYLDADLNGFTCNVACGGGPISHQCQREHRPRGAQLQDMGEVSRTRSRCITDIAESDSVHTSSRPSPQAPVWRGAAI